MLIETDVPVIPWRLARAMSHLNAEGAFAQRLLGEYRADPGFGGVLEGAASGRLQLAGAVMAARAGANRMADIFLSSATRRAAATTVVEHAFTK